MAEHYEGGFTIQPRFNYLHNPEEYSESSETDSKEDIYDYKTKIDNFYRQLFSKPLRYITLGISAVNGKGTSDFQCTVEKEFTFASINNAIINNIVGFNVDKISMIVRDIQSGGSSPNNLISSPATGTGGDKEAKQSGGKYMDVIINEIPNVACIHTEKSSNVVVRIPHVMDGENASMDQRITKNDYENGSKNNEKYFYPISLNKLTVKLLTNQSDDADNKHFIYRFSMIFTLTVLGDLPEDI